MSDSVRACPICPGAQAGKRIGRLACTTSYALSRETFDLTYCGCGALIYIDPAPTPADIRTMYEENVQFADEIYQADERVAIALEYMGSSLQHLLRRQGVAGNAPARILEVGAGRSWMSRAAKILNPASVTTAQDVSPEAVQSCPWVDFYHHGEIFDDAITTRGPYDVISLTHVIEHLVDPVGVISHCAGLLSPSGLIYVTAPHRPLGWVAGSTDIESWRGYSLNHVPAHAQYFSRESMERLARRARAKLEHWSDDPEQGQAFEAWLARRPTMRERAGTWIRATFGRR